ncbi:hypothetical protein E2C01_091289 [Portunus trituberculatus]|uniref:Uncharacterized protein n=1 Tax=Portunus trituberculatus TaxID=210409 RepID=A0A5B7JNM4_PORTR|nr:hypothetical protein [Portunus trituberculatus]
MNWELVKLYTPHGSQTRWDSLRQCLANPAPGSYHALSTRVQGESETGFPDSPRAEIRLATPWRVQCPGLSRGFPPESQRRAEIDSLIGSRESASLWTRNRDFSSYRVVSTTTGRVMYFHCIVAVLGALVTPTAHVTIIITTTTYSTLFFQCRREGQPKATQCKKKKKNAHDASSLKVKKGYPKLRRKCLKTPLLKEVKS